MKQQIFKNLFSNYIGNFLGMLLGFLIVPFLIKKLGKEAFGISVLVESIIVFFQIFAFSIRIALSRHATIALAQGDEQEFIAYLGTGKYILNILALLIFIPGALLSFYFPHIFNVPLELYNETRTLSFLIVIAFAISMPNMIYWSVLYANHRFDIINYSNFGGIIIRAIFIFLIFNFLPTAPINLVIYGLIYLSMTYGQNYIVFLWHKRIMPGLTIKPNKHDLVKLKELISFGGYSSLGGVASLVYESVMNIVINIFMGPIFNALYSISSKIPSILKRLFLTPGASLAPSFAKLAATHNTDKLQKLFLFYSKVINLVVFPMGLLLSLFSKEIIVSWVGNDFLLAAKIMPIFLIANIFTIPISICSCVNNAYGKIKFPAIATFISSIINVFLGLCLAFYLKQGLEGIAWAALWINALIYMIILPLYSCNLSKISFNSYFSETIVKPLFMIVLTFGLFVLLILTHKNLWNVRFIISALGLLIPIYIIGSYKLLLNLEEVTAVREIVHTIFAQINLNKILHSSTLK